MSAIAQQLVTALDLLAKSALTAAQIAELLQRPSITAADVQAQLDSTDAAIQHAREND